MSAPKFDVAGFDGALRGSAGNRGFTMKEVAQATGVSETTLSRMHTEGRAPDAASLAALSAWAGINPGRYSKLPRRHRAPEIADVRLKEPEQPR